MGRWFRPRHSLVATSVQAQQSSAARPPHSLSCSVSPRMTGVERAWDDRQQAALPLRVGVLPPRVGVMVPLTLSTPYAHLCAHPSQLAFSFPSPLYRYRGWFFLDLLARYPIYRFFVFLSPLHARAAHLFLFASASFTVGKSSARRASSGAGGFFDGCLTSHSKSDVSWTQHSTRKTEDSSGR